MWEGSYLRRVSVSFTRKNDSVATAGFEDGQGSQKPRNVGRLWKLETQRTVNY